MNKKLKKFVYRNYLDLVFTSTKIEGLNTSKLDTFAVVRSLQNNLSNKDIEIILNLRSTYNFILDTYDLSDDKNYFMQLNRQLALGLTSNPGRYRKINVVIGGSSYAPDMVIDYEADEFIKSYLEKATSIDSILVAGIEFMRKQFFEDVNKRTCFALMNALLLKYEYGILILDTDELNTEFKNLLTNFYEEHDEYSRNKLIAFFKDKCLNVIRVYNKQDFKGDLIPVTGLNIIEDGIEPLNKIEFNSEVTLFDYAVMRKLSDNSKIAYDISDDLVYDLNTKKVIGYVK